METSRQIATIGFRGEASQGKAKVNTGEASAWRGPTRQRYRKREGGRAAKAAAQTSEVFQRTVATPRKQLEMSRKPSNTPAGSNGNGQALLVYPRSKAADFVRQAVRFQNGIGTKRDFRKAYKFFLLAALLGDSAAEFSVGAYLEAGVGTRRDPQQAVLWFAKAAAQGDTDGIYSLGRCYAEGIGVRKDAHRAFRLIELAAARGDADAEYSLGLSYRFGRGVRRDLAEGFRWLLKAAKKGEAAAQFSVGLCYRRGEGVKPDIKQAEKWYKRSADQGDKDAQHNLRWLRAQIRSGAFNRTSSVRSSVRQRAVA